MSARHALVVGGTQGSGPAVVRRLDADGYLVSVISRRPSHEPIASARYRLVDVTDRPRFRKTLSDVVNDGGPLSALVFLQRFRGDGDEWDGELAVSLTATTTAVETLRDAFSSDGASIVFVSSNAARLVAVEQGAGYHVAKAGLRQLARYYAVVLGPKGVRVNCVSPGAVSKPGRDSPAQTVTSLYDSVTPLGREGTPVDIANAVSLLCDDRAAFVTGQDLIADGGLSLIWQETLTRQIVGLVGP